MVRIMYYFIDIIILISLAILSAIVIVSLNCTVVSCYFYYGGGVQPAID